MDMCVVLVVYMDHMQISNSNFGYIQDGYVATLSTELANESQDLTVRNAAGIALKNALTARVCGSSRMNL